jgi:hypothetical protein
MVVNKSLQEILIDAQDIENILFNMQKYQFIDYLCYDDIRLQIQALQFHIANIINLTKELQNKFIII